MSSSAVRPGSRRHSVSLWEMVNTFDNDNLEWVVDAIRDSGGLQ